MNDVIERPRIAIRILAARPQIQWRAITAGICLVLGVISAIVGLVVSGQIAIGIATTLFGIYGALTLRTSHGPRFNAMSVYCFATGMGFGLANVIAILAANTELRSIYYWYVQEQYLWDVQLIGLAAVVIPLLVWKAITRANLLALSWPVLYGHHLRRFDHGVAAMLLSGCIVKRCWSDAASLGIIGGLLDMGIALAIYSMVSKALDRRTGPVRWIGITTLVLLEVCWQFLFGYLRTFMLLPALAFIVPMLQHRRRIRFVLVAVPSLAVVFILGMADAIGRNRHRVEGTSRLELIRLERAAGDSFDILRRASVNIARLGHVNDLSSVFALAEQRGFQHGSTLQYMVFVLVPRFLWPDKPEIAPAAWFALAIGQATYVNGKVNTSVSMTFPGEMYLNFGWIGVFIGLIGFAIFTFALWQVCEAPHGENCAISHAFAFYLLFVNVFPWPDTQFSIILLAYYLLSLVAVAFLRLVTIHETRNKSVRSYSA